MSTAARLAQDARSTLTVADDLYGLGGSMINALPEILDDLEERSQDGTERLQFSIPTEGLPATHLGEPPFPGECIWLRDGPDVRSYRIVRVQHEMQHSGRVYRVDCAGARYDLDTAGPKIENRLVNWEKRATLEEWLEILLDGMPSGWTYDTTDLPDEQFRMATGGQSRLAVLENLAILSGRELEVIETSSALTVSFPELRGSRTKFRLTDVAAIRGISYEFDQRNEITHLIPQGNGQLMDRTQLDVVAVQDSGRTLFVADNLDTEASAGFSGWQGYYVGTMSDGSDAAEISNITSNILVTGSKSRIALQSDTSFSTSDKLILFQPDGTTFLFEVPGQSNPRVTQAYDVDDSGGNNLLENPLLNGTVTSNVPEGWTRIGTPTITRNTQEWNYGGASVKVVASAGGQGVEQIRSDEEGGSAFNMGACAWLFITSGKVRVQAIQTASGTDTRFPADDKTGQGVADETDRWIRVSVPGQPGLVGGGIRVTSYDGAATFILDAASPFIGNPPPHPEVGRFSHRLLVKACARMRQFQRANEPSINGAIIDYKRLAGDPPFNPGDDVEVWIRRTENTRYEQTARVSSVRTRPTVRGDTQLVLEHKVRAMDAILRPRQVPAGTGVPLLPNAVAIPQDEEGNAGGLTADQQALLDIVDESFTDDGAIEQHVVRQDQSTAFSFMSGLFSGVAQDGDQLALPVVGTAVPLIEVSPARCLVDPHRDFEQDISTDFPNPLTSFSSSSPHSVSLDLLVDPVDNRVVFNGRMRIETHNRWFRYRPFYIKDGSSTRVYIDSQEYVGPGNFSTGGLADWRVVTGSNSPLQSQLDAGTHIMTNTWVDFACDVVWPLVRAGDTVGLEVYRQNSSTTARLDMEDIHLGRIPRAGRMVIGANGISKSGFTLVGKILYRSGNTLTGVSFALGLLDQTIGSTDQHELQYTPYLGEVSAAISIGGADKRVTVAVDVRDGSSAWREVARRTTIHLNPQSRSSAVLVTANIAFTDTSLGIGDDVRIRLVDVTDAAGADVPGTNPSVDIDATFQYSYAVGTDVDISQTMTPLTSDTLAWRSVHGESF